MALDATSKSILGTAIGLQSTALMAKNLKLIPKKGKPITSKKLIKAGVGNIIGIGLIRTQSDILAQS